MKNRPVSQLEELEELKVESSVARRQDGEVKSRSITVT